MADRALRDPQLAHAQLLKRQAREIRALNKRAYQGALRSGVLPFKLGQFGVPQAIISLDISQGRWAIDAMVIAEATQATATIHIMELIIGGLETGTDLTPVLDGANYTRGQVPGTGDVRLPLIFTGDFRVEEAATVTMRVWSAPSVDMTWTNARLRLAPF